MSTTTPSTPENAPHTKMALNRSFTLPSKLATSTRIQPTAEIGATAGVETRYVTPNSKVVKFVTSSSAGAGTIPWKSSTEKTVAAGPLEIYHVPGSVSFLHSGPLLHAILPRSQCWCVDGVSIFAMRVLPDTYYRIELAGESPEDLAKVEEFKDVLKTVLFFERTPCPFARGFTIDLPEERAPKQRKRRSHGPAKKWKLHRGNSWKPEDGGEPPVEYESSTGGSEETDDDDLPELPETENRDQGSTSGSARSLQISIPKTPTRISVKDRIQGLTSASRSFTAPPQFDLANSLPTVEPAVRRLEEAVVSQKNQIPPRIVPSTPRRTFQPMPTSMPPSPPDSSAGLDTIERSAGAIEHVQDSQLSVVDNDDSVIITEMVEEEYLPQNDHIVPQSDTVTVDATAKSLESLSRDVDTQTVEGTELHEIDEHDAAQVIMEVAKLLEADTTETSPSHNQPETTANLPVSPTNVSQPTQSVLPMPATAELETDDDPFAQIQARIQARRSIGGTISFHPGIHSPIRQSSASTASMASRSAAQAALTRRAQHLQHQHHQQALATALVRKACAVFLGPPAHLVSLMLRIAARFANGTFGDAFAWPASPAVARDAEATRVPGSFDLDGSDVEDFDDAYLDEDDFGVPLDSPIRLAARDLGRIQSLGSSSLRARNAWENS